MMDHFHLCVNKINYTNSSGVYLFFPSHIFSYQLSAWLTPNNTPFSSTSLTSFGFTFTVSLIFLAGLPVDVGFSVTDWLVLIVSFVVAAGVGILVDSFPSI